MYRRNTEVRMRVVHYIGCQHDVPIGPHLQCLANVLSRIVLALAPYHPRVRRVSNFAPARVPPVKVGFEVVVPFDSICDEVRVARKCFSYGFQTRIVQTHPRITRAVRCSQMYHRGWWRFGVVRKYVQELLFWSIVGKEEVVGNSRPSDETQ
jgi:hypothetical protein